MRRYCPRLQGKALQQGQQLIILVLVAQPSRGGEQTGRGRPREPSQVFACVVSQSSLLGQIKDRQFDDPRLAVLRETVLQGNAKKVDQVGPLHSSGDYLYFKEAYSSDDSARKLGAYLIQAQLQASNSSSALFLTAAANNLLCLKLAEGLGVKTSSKWLTWFKVSSIPAIISLLASPAILYKIFPLEMKNTPDAPLMARRKLEQMGPIKSDQWVMMIVMLVTVALWISGEALGLASVITAMLGLSLLLAFGILTWDDCLSEKSAWDTLAWFGVLIGMATQLTTLGVVAWMSNVVANFLNSLSLHWFGAFCILLGTYYFIHYLFASQTAHVAALYPALLGMCLASKIPNLLATLLLGYFSNLFGALTHYSSGQAAVYYGAGYVELRDVFKMGITIALINIAIWGLVGAGWWKILGLY
uniref:Dicarboxylate transporter 2.1, chloroplastic-like n=3 Tax=Nicotiana tabacum TaxID=4097 RepID=A0A1S3ZS47_TOBAC|nr:PREDICTED: dicarboxylate transporter 2.1, chloroplastic-like [Nicotiana tabacum]